jgi:Fe-S-cluster-containing hydrogenase component 2
MYEIDQEKCKKDGDCVAVCPTEAIEKKDDGTFNVNEGCIDCGACVEACETEAIHPT